MSKQFPDDQGFAATASMPIMLKPLITIVISYLEKKKRFINLLESHDLDDQPYPMLRVYRAITHFFSFSQHEIHNQLVPILTTMAGCNLNKREQLYYIATDNRITRSNIS